MVAIAGLFYYTIFMTKTVAYLSGVMTISFVLSTAFLDQISMFIMIGKLPFTNIQVPATGMLAFWALLVPATLLTRHFSSSVGWGMVQYLGILDQRRLNSRRHRRLQLSRNHSVALYTIVLLHIASQLPECSTNNPDLFFRKRFIALPA